MPTMEASTADKRIDDLKSWMAEDIQRVEERIRCLEGEICEIRDDIRGLLRETEVRATGPQGF